MSIMKYKLRVLEMFSITGRGTVASCVVEDLYKQPKPGDKISIFIFKDSLPEILTSVVTSIECSRNFFENSDIKIGQKVGFCLRGIQKEDVPVGSIIVKF